MVLELVQLERGPGAGVAMDLDALLAACLSNDTQVRHDTRGMQRRSIRRMLGIWRPWTDVELLPGGDGCSGVLRQHKAPSHKPAGCDAFIRRDAMLFSMSLALQ